MKNALLVLLALFSLGCPSPTPDPSPAPTQSFSPIPPAQDSLTGITIDDISDLPSIINSIKSLPKRITVRVVFDVPNAPSYYASAITELLKVADVLAQPADSTYVKGLSFSAYQKRFQDYVAAFPQITLWEIGNEVNGDWLGTGVPAKIDAAFDVVKGAGKKAVIVPYWNTLNCADKNGLWSTWISNNISTKVKQGSDYSLISIYGKDCDGPEPTPSELQAIYITMASLFPNAMLGVGEMGGSESATSAEREKVIRYYYTLPRIHFRDLGFYGYWFFKEDMVPNTKPLWSVMNQVLQ